MTINPNPRRSSKGLEPVFDLLDDNLDETGDFQEETVTGTGAESPASEWLAEIRLPGYQILGILGRGGMGVVYRALDESLNRQVAIKTLSAALIGSEDAKERFEREAQLLAKLQHEHIARVYQTGLVGERPYFVMELIEGPSLAEKIGGAPLAASEAARMLFDLAEALEESHRQGVIHRDLKPSNVLLDANGMLKVTDFGLARLHGETSSVTRTGEVMGTPSYMAPEQASGVVKEMKPTTDVYGMGAILYEMLTGRPVFQAPEPAQVLLMVLQMEPVAPRQLQPQIPKDLETICLRCLEKSPSRRYPSARAVAEDLHRFLIGEPIHARPVSRSERAWKWIRRHPWQSVAAVTITTAVLLSLAGFAWHNQQLSRELQRTRRVVDEGRGLSSWLLKEYLHELERPGGLTEKRTALVDRLTTFLDTIGEESGNYRESGRELAASFEVIATLQGDPFDLSLGQIEQAEQSLRRSLAIRTELARSQPERTELLTERDHTTMMLAIFYLGQLRVDEAQQQLQQAKEAFLKRYPDYATRDLEPLEITLWSGIVSLQGDLDAQQGRYDEAYAAYKQAKAWLDQHGDRLSPAGRTHAETLAAERLADVLAQRGDYEEALQLTENAITRVELELPENVEPVQSRSMLVALLMRKGDLLSWLQNQPQALVEYQRAELELETHLLPFDPDNLTLLSKQSLLWGRQSNIALLMQETELATSLAEKSHLLCRRLALEHPQIMILQEKWFTSFHNLYSAYVQAGELDQGKQKIEELLTVLEPQASQPNPYRVYLRIVAETYQSLGLLHARAFSAKMDETLSTDDLKADYEASLQAFSTSQRRFEKLAQAGVLEGSEAIQQANVEEMLEFLQQIWTQLQEPAVPDAV